MPDLIISRLESLRDGAPVPVDDRVVASDLDRGRRALGARRRKHRFAAASVTALAAVAASASYAAAAHSQPAHQVAGASGPSAQPAAAVPLVAYRGSQLAGYTVKTVPRGYVLQGVSASVLDIAKAGDHSPLDTFVGKITVMLNDHPGPATGTAETVNGHAGRLNTQGGVQILTYSDGTHNVEVQSWSNIHLTGDQLVQFADGITVLSGAEVGHG